LIPPEEITAALELVARKEMRIASDDLIKRAAKLMGFTRAGTKVTKGFRVVLDALLAAGGLSEEDGVITIEDA
jgi:hypothetical protein